jgi:hypothetical protein
MLRVVKTSDLLRDYRPLASLNVPERVPIAVLSRMGKSGAALSPLLRNFVSREVLEISAAIPVIAKYPGKPTLHVFEDALWTGVELQRVVDSLVGIGDSNKVSQLADPSQLRDLEIILHFPLQTDLGQLAATEFLKSRDLSNIKVHTENIEFSLNVLTDEAREKFEDGKYGFSHVRDNLIAAHDVTPIVSRLTACWLKSDVRDRAVDLVCRVGSQLYPGKGQFGQLGQGPMPFGAGAIGSNIVFSHSAPRAALPVYWADGLVKVNAGRGFAWTALTPERQAQSPGS